MPRKSELFTEDPYYLPRYCGYLPQYKYRIGKTYGHHSLDILTDPNVRKSGSYVLTDTSVPPTENKVDERRLLLRSRQDSWGNQIITDQLVPGYTGYIPKKQHYFANSYAEVCRSALAHHEYEQREHKAKREEAKKLRALQSGTVRPVTESDKSILMSRYLTPLPPKSRDAATYKPLKEFRPQPSPYFMPDDNEMKWFKSGYTGFVPRTRELISMTYPTATNKGLRTFSANMAAHSGRQNDPVQVQRREEVQKRKSVIYPPDKGMVPHYTGYIPGYKYQIGHTYGQHTFSAMSKVNVGHSLATAT